MVVVYTVVCGVTVSVLDNQQTAETHFIRRSQVTLSDMFTSLDYSHADVQCMYCNSLHDAHIKTSQNFDCL